MSEYQKLIVESLPGIDRDNTEYSTQFYTDGQWVRFYQGKPRKINGSRIIASGDTEIIRTLSLAPYTLSETAAELEGISDRGQYLLYVGRRQSVTLLTLNNNFVTSPEISRTPASLPDLNIVWEFTYITTTVGELNANYIIAHANPNGDSINGTLEGEIYFGVVNDSSPLERLDIDQELSASASGGVIVINEIIVTYGNDGYIKWCEPGNILSWPATNIQAIASSKIIEMKTARSSGIPSALCWTTNSLIEIKYNGTSNTWDINIIEDSISILSKRSVVKNNSTYVWQGTNQTYIYNGVVNELQNNLNKQYLFGNLNYEQREKVFGFVNKQWNEIWFLVPLNNSEENNHAFIYNDKLNTHYDTAINKTCCAQSQLYPYPIMADSVAIPNYSTLPPPGEQPSKVYVIRAHEVGLNNVEWSNTFAINSYFTTKIFTLFDPNQFGINALQNDYNILGMRIEPDFLQNQILNLKINGKAYPNSVSYYSPIKSFNSSDEKLDFNFNARLISFTFQSNVLNGFYQLGKTILDYKIGAQRP